MAAQVKRGSVIVALLLVAAIGVVLQAQDGRPEGGDRGERRDRGGQWDPAQMAERMNARLREQLKVNDEEWAVLSPKMTRLTTAQRNLRGGFGGMGFGGRRGGPDGGAAGGNDANVPQTPVAKASGELRQTLDKEDAPAEEVAEKLGALRAARREAEAELAAARKDLREVLTQRQEATLVLMGMLD